jgi:glutamate-1-semialdehyde aminotransferase
MNLKVSAALLEKAREVVPGAIPGIRSPDNFVPGAYPTLLAGGQGGRITDVDGNEYVDLLLGYGPIILGHAEPEVDETAFQYARNGFCLNLPQPVMIELAERLTELVPCAEQALFFKTGSDATTAAVRIARAHTGRQLILRCGYHGWHDWCLEDDPGVPRGAEPTVASFTYNAADDLAQLMSAHDGQVAGIVMTPVGHDFDAQITPPVPGFLEEVRRLTDEQEAVLIFDEVRTGFRLAPGGAQALYGVTPDLTALGKAMANGYPITSLVGKRAIMESADETFISSTYFPNGMEMAAALQTLTALVSNQALAQIEITGKALNDGYEQIVAETSLPVTLSSYPQMPFLHFTPDLDAKQTERRDRFYAALASGGVFAHPKHHGFVCYRHTPADVDQVLDRVRSAARAL